MINAIMLIVCTALGIILTAINPFWAAIYLFFILCFFVIMIYKGRCALLIGKEDCELWELYLIKEQHFWEEPLPNDKNEKGK